MGALTGETYEKAAKHIYSGNIIVNAVTNQSQKALNALHTFFAIGAISCPLIVMAAVARDPHGWRAALLVILGVSVIAAICSCLIDFGSVEVIEKKEGSKSWAFLKDRRFIMLLIMMFFTGDEFHSLGSSAWRSAAVYRNIGESQIYSHH